jgi:hypothetical protein
MNYPNRFRTLLACDFLGMLFWGIAIGAKMAVIMTLNSLWLGVQGISALMLASQILGLSQPVFLKFKPRLLTLACIMQASDMLVILFSAAYCAGIINAQTFVIMSAIVKLISGPFGKAYSNLFKKQAAESLVNIQWLATVEQTIASASTGTGTLVAMALSSIVGVKGLIAIAALSVAISTIFRLRGIFEIVKKGW